MKQTDLYPVRVGDTLKLTDPKTGEPIFVTLVDARDGLFRIEVQAPPHIRAQGIKVIPRPH
jgi:hypothetical protein